MTGRIQNSDIHAGQIVIACTFWEFAGIQSGDIVLVIERIENNKLLTNVNFWTWYVMTALGQFNKISAFGPCFRRLNEC